MCPRTDLVCDFHTAGQNLFCSEITPISANGVIWSNRMQRTNHYVHVKD